MGSPPLSRHELQGSSRTTGGILRGRAQGNNPNIADFANDIENLISIIGKVHLYVTADDPKLWNLATMNYQTIKLPVTSSLTTILQEIGDRYSPVRRKLLTFVNYIFSLLFRKQCTCLYT